MRTCATSRRVAVKGRPRMAIEPQEHQVWLAILFPAGASDVVGAVRSSSRLHWTAQDARDEAERWIAEMRIGPITWAPSDGPIVVGRTPTHLALIRGIPLPRGDRPTPSAFDFVTPVRE